jgi:hypothetical protein
MIVNLDRNVVSSPALWVPCKRCDAEIGSRCRAKGSGLVAAWIHNVRQEDARLAFPELGQPKYLQQRTSQTTIGP